jgi:hypothetical protein
LVQTKIAGLEAAAMAKAVGGESGNGAFPSRTGEMAGGEEVYLGPEWTRTKRGHEWPAGVLQGWEQMEANDVGWPTFDGKFVNDPGPLSRRNGGPTGRLITEDDLVTKTLRER